MPPTPSNRAMQQYYIPLQTQVLVSGETTRFDIARVGYYLRLRLNIRGTINTVAGSVDPRGIAALIKRVQVESNFTSVVFDMSGTGYNYLLRPRLGLIGDPLLLNNGRNRIEAATKVVLDMVIPFCVNDQSLVGILVGGNPRSLFSVNIEREQDAILGVTDWTDQPTVTPWLEWSSVPEQPELRPRTNILHRIIETRTPISAVGDFVHNWDLGSTVIAHYYGYGLGEIDTPICTDKVDNIDVQWNQVTYYMQRMTPEKFDLMECEYRGQQRVPGTYALDLIGSSGLGDYSTIDNAVQTLNLTEAKTLFTANDTDTFYAVRRELAPLSIPT